MEREQWQGVFVMGVAAYNRASAVVVARTRDGQPTLNELFIRDLNALPKYPDAGQPFGDLIFTHSRGVWWVNAIDRPDGFGYWYKTLREAVRRWRVAIYGVTQSGQFLGASSSAEPAPQATGESP